MTPYKRADLAVEAFNRLGLPLVMVGDGEMAAAVRKRAGANITVLDRVGYAELRRLYAHCRALVFTAEEDFGIVPVEAMAAGRPVLAFGRGGALDSVLPGKTGLFFAEQHADSLIDGVERMERWLPSFNPLDAVENAQRFSLDAFDRNILSSIGAFADAITVSLPVSSRISFRPCPHPKDEVRTTSRLQAVKLFPNQYPLQDDV